MADVGGMRGAIESAHFVIPAEAAGDKNVEKLRERYSED